MNRENRTRESSGSTRQRISSSSSTSSSSNHLMYLFIISAASVVLLPHLFPILSSMVLSSGKKSDVMEQEDKFPKRNQPPPSSPSPVNVPSFSMPDYGKTRVSLLNSDKKCDILEGYVMELQRVVHFERDKVLQLENVIRGLQVSDNFMKEKLQYLEDKTWEARRGATSVSLDILQNTDGKDTASSIIQNLLKLVQTERERITTLETEIRFLKNSETVLENKVDKIENQFAALCKKSNLCDSNT